MRFTQSSVCSECYDRRADDICSNLINTSPVPYAEDPRAHPFGNSLDRPALTRGVAPFEQ